jgi:phosphonate transport system permease protein
LPTQKSTVQNIFLASNDSTIKERIGAFESERDRIERKKLTITITGLVVFGLAFIGSAIIGQFRISYLKDIPNMLNYIEETLPVLRLPYLGHDIDVWYGRGGIWVSDMFDTILIAFLSTLISTVLAFILCFPASKNLNQNSVIYFLVRRILDVARGVPELVYAMIFVFAFNLGPLPGVFAIAVHSMGSLGKLFSEVNENIDWESVEGIRSTGANWFQIIRYAVVPQVLPNFISYAILRFEINIRASTIIGMVGAGGIGVELMFAIRQFQYQDISAIVLMIIVVVMSLDMVCERIRHNIIRREQ